MPRCKAPEILRNEVYLNVRRNDEGKGKRSRWVFFSSLQSCLGRRQCHRGQFFVDGSFLFLFLILGSFCFSTTALGDAFSPKDLVIETLPANGSARGVKATGIIRSKPEAVWRALTDYPAFPEYMPNILESKVQREEGNTSWVAIKFSATVKNLNYVLKIVHERNVRPWKITWTRVEGDLRSIDGHYVLYEIPEGTRLEYVEMVDSGSFVPGFVQETLTRHSIPNLYKAVAERAAKYEKG